MKRIIVALTVVVLFCGVSYGQDVPEQLKDYQPMIGTWVYDGPLLEDVEGVGQEGSKLNVQFTWKRILNKTAVERTWLVKLDDGRELSGKILIGWNAKEQQLACGGMSSNGDINLGTVVFDKEAKTCTLAVQGINGEGEATGSKAVVTKTGKDTLTWQVLERTNGLAEGASPVYTFKRAPRTGKKKSNAAKQRASKTVKVGIDE